MITEIRRLLAEIIPHKKKVIIIAVSGIVYSTAYARLVLILKDIYDNFEKGNINTIKEVSAIALTLALLVAISRYYHIFWMNFVSEMVVNNLRLKLQKKFMSLNLAFHGSYAAGSGGLLSRIMNDIKVVQDGLRMVADFFREPLLAVLLLGNLFYLNWKLTLAILILLPIILHFLRQISKSLRKYVLSGQENLERMTSTIKESLDGVRIIQSFNLENELSKKLEKETTEYLEIRRKVHSRIEVMGPVTEFIATAVILSIFMYFSHEVSEGTTTTGAVIAYIASLMALNQPIKKLQESYVRIQETVVASERIHKILDEKSEVPLSEKNLPFPKDWKQITYSNVSFAYHDNLTLKKINLTINRGEHIALVGESGSGKSTIVNLLERFYDPTEGEIRIDGILIQDLDLKALRKNIALVSQDVFLFSDTIERNIQAGDFSKSLTQVPDVAKHANANDFILRMPQSYQSRVGDRGSLLSGGEKQRVSIARAFFKDAPLIILDEATSALDSASEIEVQKGLDLLMEGRTALVIAHRLSTIQSADKIIVMKSGEIVEQGHHQELIDKKGEYYRFYSIQNRG